MRIDCEEAVKRRIQIYDELRNVRQDISAIKQNFFSRANIRDLVAHYNEYDRRINVHYDGHNILRGTLDNEQLITCFEYRDTGIGALPNLPRIAHIYNRISARVQLQGFYGIYETAGRKYSIMEDLSSWPTLSSSIQQVAIPSLLTRLRMAYEIANTMAYLHQVGMLLKSLSDATVYLKVVNGEEKPIITDLESARLVLIASIQISSHVIRFSRPQALFTTTSGTRHPNIRIRNFIRYSLMFGGNS